MLNNKFILAVLFGFIVVLYKIELANAVTCTYYPNYPIKTPANKTTCSDKCCSSSVSVSISTACCVTTTDYSYLGISLGLGLGMPLFIFALTFGLGFGCYFLQKKARAQRMNVGPNWQNPTVQAQFAGKYPTTQYPPATSTYPSAGATASIYPTTNSNIMDPPPKYDAFMNQPATTNIGSTENQLPVLPSSIEMNPKY